MEIRLRVQMTIDYFRNAMKKHERLNRARPLRIILTCLSCALLIFFSVMILRFPGTAGLSPRLCTIGAILVFIGIGSFFLQKINEFGFAWAFKKSPEFNSIREVCISDEGIHSVDDAGSSFVKWTASSVRGIFFPDGIMLLRAGDDYGWYPAANFASPEDYQNALAIIQKNIREIRVIRG